MTTTAIQQTHKVTKSQADLKGRSIHNIDCRDDAPASPTYRELQIDATAFLVQWWIRKRLHQNIRMHKIWFEWDQCRPEFKSIDKFLSSFSHFAHTLRDQSVVRTIMFDHFLAWRLMCSTANLRLKSDRVIQWLRPVQDYLWNTHLHSPNLEIQGMSCEPKPNLRQEASTLDVWLVLPSGRPSRTMSPHRTWVHQVLTIFFLKPSVMMFVQHQVSTYMNTLRSYKCSDDLGAHAQSHPLEEETWRKGCEGASGSWSCTISSSSWKLQQ